MNKSAIKNFAVSARKKLIEQVMQEAFQIGITAKTVTELKQEADHIILNNIPQEKGFKLQRDKLIKEIEQKGYDQVMEEVAYTWFNRFIALRFMEVNDYLPTGVRVLSSLDPSRAEPDIIREALNVGLVVDQTMIYGFQDSNDSEGLFKYLLIHQCNDLNKILPFMFETISNYTELLFPSNLLQEGSVIRDLVTSIPEDDWKEVEIIGWLYQYYISEKKDEVFADLKKNIKITKENIPAATQLFTPKWIVQYMVENSLGRLWLESHPDDELKAQWKYYLEEAEQEPEVQQQLEALKNPDLNPIDIKALDPCCGSGHILVYAFEVLYEIYKNHGYMEEDIPKLILENNLYGLDIDDRAAQLASFAVMMKARSKNRGVFRENIKLNICAIQESNWMSNEVREILVDRDAMELEQNRQRELITYLADTFKDAKEFGSILDVREIDLEFLEQRFDEVANSVARDLFEDPYRDVILEKLSGLILQARIMAKKYDVVCTNPPYMGRKGMNPRLTDYVEKKFADSKSDLFAVFIQRNFSFLKQEGFNAMVTMHSWMFLDAYLKFRKMILSDHCIYSILHLGMEAFENIIGKVVQTAAFIFRNKKIGEIKPVCIRLVDFYDSRKYEKEIQFFDPKNLFSRVKQEEFNKIPCAPIAYWVSDKVFALFDKNILVGDFGYARQGLATSDNNRFLRQWYEVEYNRISLITTDCDDTLHNGYKWYPYNKGGDFRKWYGNNAFIVNFEKNGEEIKETVLKKYPYLKTPDFVVKNTSDYFKSGLTWSDVSSSTFSCRYIEKGFIFADAGPMFFCDHKIQKFMLGCFNSIPFKLFLEIFCSGIHYSTGHIPRVPCLMPENQLMDTIEVIVNQNIVISKTDWNSFEISWEFDKHQLLKMKQKSNGFILEQLFNKWQDFTETQFNQLKDNEEELNRIFIEIYGLQDELTPEVEDKDITIRKADQSREIKSFISYAVGCMLGRYSLDEEGLILAGGKFDPERYKTFKADDDGVLPVLSDAYFDNDIVTQFAEFVKVIFGQSTLATNLDYIAETLARKTNESSRECIQRYFLKDFYKDHVQMYKKRPIYWMFTSGKEQGFNALVYMHRYDSSMVSRVRTDYLHPLQNKLEAEFLRLNQVLVSEDSPTEKTKATKRLKVLTKQMDELKKYDEVIHNLADQQIEIDLDDGVVVNYAKFEKVLAKI
ncbi:MAG TPA: BREX-1 system adenine-specific DNA-methyltransferase PglX [Desulfosporosinus sp.]|nr:BREX-1 system adenine-specific DNA-methyltransferase PglX [Desulfosporosinus sp.]